MSTWVPVPEGSGFGVNNLPYGVFSQRGELPRVCVAIGEHVLDLAELAGSGLLADRRWFAAGSLNAFMAAGRTVWQPTRDRIVTLLTDMSYRDEVEPALSPMADIELHMPFAVPDYVDFYSSREHATNLGRILRPGSEPLLPNWNHLPVGYHGRSGTVVPSGTPIVRPLGQRRGDHGPVFGPTLKLDVEAEIGFVVGLPSALGQRVPTSAFRDHVFGFVLVNDWSARDIQSWEYQPLGPFLSKSFATTISPWVVTWEALEPYRVPAFFRPPSDPQPLPYLSSETDKSEGGVDLTIEVYIRSMLMREGHMRPTRLSAASLADMYWTPAQMLTHHTSNGCNVRPGDLFASGTVSGPDPSSQGCLLELTRRGAEPIVLPTGEERKFLHDGDEIVLRGFF